ncbi:thioredoxin domain-containing protein [Brachybacterium muris]|uniref:DsbA family protein n=1 Tax=Brachybacterium muris TaxID=219301 RepID=UPI0021A7FB15|nr:thioredoxin domain-containing protein [Brachybacterium muris]MCT1429276.1 thioredoxin domain-containing protein [Brachybacterium muris]
MTSLPTPGRRSLLLGGGAVLALGLAACGSTDETPSDPATSSGGRDIDRSLTYLELAGDSDGKVVDLLLDFRCPPCRSFMESFGEMFRTQVEQKALVLRIHPRPMLDLRRGTTFSQDSAAAAAAVYAQDPALLLDFEREMYAAQPETPEQPDPDPEQIAEIARSIGADETCLQQIRDRVYVPWTLDVVEPAAQELEVGTPTMIIDGEIWQGDWTQPGAVEDALGV